jgi:hypothetical protein
VAPFGNRARALPAKQIESVEDGNMFNFQNTEPRQTDSNLEYSMLSQENIEKAIAKVKEHALGGKINMNEQPAWTLMDGRQMAEAIAIAEYMANE